LFRHVILTKSRIKFIPSGELIIRHGCRIANASTVKKQNEILTWRSSHEP
jgi:hypothetical protein